MRTKTMIAGIALAAASLAAAPALAKDGCGPDRYRAGPFGHCHWDGPPPPPPGYYAPPPPPGYYGPQPVYYGPAYGPGPAVVVVDRWYPGRGYWDGQRYWWHRHHWHGGWRYY